MAPVHLPPLTSQVPSLIGELTAGAHLQASGVLLADSSSGHHVGNLMPCAYRLPPGRSGQQERCRLPWSMAPKPGAISGSVEDVTQEIQFGGLR